MGNDYYHEKFGAFLALPFGIANAVTAAAAVDLHYSDIVMNNTLFIPPASGSVVGISVAASAEVTAGSVSFAAHKDGTEFTQTGYPNPTLNTTAATTQESYVNVRPGVLTFAAGEGLGVSYTSSTDCAPTNTNDYAVTLFVQLDPYGA